MNLELSVNEQLTDAMKKQEKTKIDVLRAIKKSIIEFKTSGSGKELNEEEAIKLLNQQAKMRKDSIEMFENGGRQELADKEKAELEVIISFLPKQLTENEVKEIAIKIKEEMGANLPSDMGKLMGAVMKQVSGKADGKLVQGIVKEILS
jgi:uncharacterized protein YqeY